MTGVRDGTAAAPPLWPRLAIFAVWLGLVIALSIEHEFWRDEVRALSIALGGGDVVAMLRGLHGEGHPALWYLLLRGAHTLWATPAVLPVVAVTVAAIAALLVAVASPFRLWLVAAILASRFMLYDHSVVARNYGLTTLLLFALAAAYRRHRDHGVVLGGLLFLLANTNVPATFLAAAFLLFWLIDTLAAHGVRWTPALANFAVNAAIAAAGAAVCAATVYPTFNDAAVADIGAIGVREITVAIVRPAGPFEAALLALPWDAVGLGSLKVVPYAAALKWLASALVFASLLGLIRRPAAFVAAFVALTANSLFFTLVYHGQYRHQSLWLAFLVAMYWIVLAPGPGPRREVRLGARAVRLAAAGFAAFVTVIGLQVLSGLRTVANVAADAPLSRAREAAALVASTPGLARATIIADPDYFIETLPYYIGNPTYLIREQRFGRYARFTKNARLNLSLDDILATARRLAATTQAPVVILLAQRLDPAAPAQRHKTGYNWEIAISPAEVRAFLGATTRLARCGPAPSGESYDVYRLDPPGVPSTPPVGA